MQVKGCDGYEDAIADLCPKLPERLYPDFAIYTHQWIWIAFNNQNQCTMKLLHVFLNTHLTSIHSFHDLRFGRTLPTSFSRCCGTALLASSEAKWTAQGYVIRYNFKMQNKSVLWFVWETLLLCVHVRKRTRLITRQPRASSRSGKRSWPSQV